MNKDNHQKALEVIMISLLPFFFIRGTYQFKWCLFAIQKKKRKWHNDKKNGKFSQFILLKGVVQSIEWKSLKRLNGEIK